VLAPAVLETGTSTPWAYAHVARTLMNEVDSGLPALDAGVARAGVCRKCC